jgi:hypothetical protein
MAGFTLLLYHNIYHCSLNQVHFVELHPFAHSLLLLFQNNF